MPRKKRSFNIHNETTRENSYYWMIVLKNNHGDVKKAEQEILQSRKRVDPTYHSGTFIKKRFR